MENKKMTTPIVSVGADTEQSPNVCNDSITDFNEDGKSLDDYLEEMQKEFSKQMSPSYLKTVSMSELYDTVFNVQTPLIDGLLQRGTYIFAGSPKVGKSYDGTACLSHKHRHTVMGLQSAKVNCALLCT